MAIERETFDKLSVACYKRVTKSPPPLTFVFPGELRRKLHSGFNWKNYTVIYKTIYRGVRTGQPLIQLIEKLLPRVLEDTLYTRSYARQERMLCDIIRDVCPRGCVYNG